jgi:SAM-dependent methyltransferase
VRGQGSGARLPGPPRPPKPDADLLGALELLRQRREPYAPLQAQIVGEILDRFPPLAEGPIVEIGAGTGQLREWLPPALRDRLVHTDPSDTALRVLRDRSPQARIRVAPADRLPFDDQSVAAVVGLCVFDALPDPAAARAELRRVLAPGGRFVHFLDMATLLEAPFAKLAASGLVPIPNVFADPGDHEWPLDIVLLKRAWLEGLLRSSGGVDPPFATELRAYFRSFLAEPFDTNAATGAFKVLASHGDRRRALVVFLELAGRAAFGQGLPAIEPLPFHSGRYLQSVMESTFRGPDHFVIELDQIVTRAGWRAPSAAAPRTVPSAATGGPRYQSLCVGHQRLLEAPPRRLLDASALRLLGDRTAPTSDILIEVGTFVFVARRTG